MWHDEAKKKKRERQQQAGAGTIAFSQCVKDRTGMDPDLDPSRQRQPATTCQEQPTSPYAEVRNLLEDAMTET